MMNYETIQENIIASYKSLATLFSKKTASHNHDNEFILKFVNLFSPGASILDAGCGTGEIAAELQGVHGFQVIGIDISEDMIALAKERYPEVSFQNMDICNMDFPMETFDGVFAYFALIHIPKSKILVALKELYRVTKKNGYVFITVQETDEAGAMEGVHPVPYDPQTELFLNLMTQEEISSLVIQAGFKIADTCLRSHEENEFPFGKFSLIVRK